MSNLDTPELLALEAKIGHTFTIKDWTAIRRKAIETLTADDLTVITAFEGTASAEALRTRRQPAPSPSTPAPKSAHMNEKTLELLASAVATAIKEAVTPVAGRIAELETRLAALEAKPHVKFCGVYESGRAYTPGDACTHGGGLWICKAATTGQPNQDYAGWALAVKSRSLTP